MNLPLEANTNLFASFFCRQYRQRRCAFRQRALPGTEIVAVTMIIAPQQTTVEKLSGAFQVCLFMRAVSRKSEIFALNERQEHLTPAEGDLFHAAGC
jgi:hypothetical protein